MINLKPNTDIINVELFAPVAGKLKNIEDVNDVMFSQKMMGDGFAVTPTDGDIYAPVSGVITSVFPTKHAYGINADGVELLVHLGINTVDLNGEPFEVFVNEGDLVTPATKIAVVDLAAIAAAGKDSDIIVIATNADDLEGFDVTAPREVKAGDEVAQAQIEKR
ncbi:MAG: PTS glucose transporter subunit IIA [Lactobacillales bacterium]|jgi:PTS system trehalose-specific IIC component|nr:PTS glucose transporter subunit IIA [Lactobacillales bacterium]